ncbi:hypothetical protein [Tenggerimyces flavus]|uniref:DUF8091 domain-containing protein n=1 Tax=Tenggerimyces flavus TaxID=1708749 RepID=A0ABV7YQS2_9ACTN|nr:hypothetical protein [Tenggerimyces flavus]MBM7786315.1 hypothetical protein [Tenggerimyces flavus]
MTEVVPHIGTLREKHLHAALKQWYARPGDRFEVPVDGFVVDLVRGDQLIEVQTRGFSSMKRKAVALLGLGHRLRIVHPIPVDKWIVKIDADGVLVSRRRSPRHGSAADIFGELVSIADVLGHPLLEIEVLLTTVEEHWRHGLHRAWRRRGWSVVERRLLEVVQAVRLDNLADLLPQDLPEEFTTADLAKKLSRPQRAAQQMAYCLRRVGTVTAVGKQGNAVIYQRTSNEQP